jgi:hypothetical protein
MALSDVLWQTSEDLRHYADDEFYQRMYGEKTTERVRRIIELCDELRMGLDAPPATVSQHTATESMKGITLKP